jgi:hypothetical protein
MLHLKDIGISIIPIVQVERIGLIRVRASFELEANKIRELKHFFTVLNETAGLRYYSRSSMTRKFDCEFNIPEGTLGVLSTLLEKLEDSQILSGVSLRRVLWKDFPNLKTEYFDYPRGFWDVDYTRLSSKPSTTVRNEFVEAGLAFDEKDLLITKELEIDPWSKVTELSKKLDYPARVAGYHLSEHVLGEIIRSFRIRWIGSQDAWSKHSIIGMTLVFRNVSNQIARHIMAVLTGVPFLWSHSRTEHSGYLAEFLIPLQMFTETTQFISGGLEQIGVTPEILLPDWSCSSSYTIPYQLFNQAERSWRFDVDKTIAGVFLRQRASVRSS